MLPLAASSLSAASDAYGIRAKESLSAWLYGNDRAYEVRAMLLKARKLYISG
jgi:hypothetical protein